MDAEVSVTELRERARTTHWEPPTYGLERPLWTAEDPVTGCVGVGHVEEEAFGNLVAVVRRYEADDGGDDGYTKLPGRTVTKPLGRARSDGLVERMKRTLGR